MRLPALGLSFALALSACAVSQRRVDSAHPAAAVWMRTELYFAIGPARVATDETLWRDFIDREITPRFPDGLSVFDVYGQWRAAPDAAIEREHSKQVLLLYADSPQHRRDIEAIRNAWKQATGEKSVLRVSQPADVSF